MTQRAVSLKDHKSNKISVKISKAKKKETNYQYQTLNRDFNEKPPDIKNIKRMLDVQAGFRKGRGTRDQIANICWIIEKAREFQKNIYFCFIDYAKAFESITTNKASGGDRIPVELFQILKDDAVKVLHSIC